MNEFALSREQATAALRELEDAHHIALVKRTARIPSSSLLVKAAARRPQSAVTQVTQSVLEAARDAMAQHDWERARDLFLEAEQAAPLDPADLERLGDAGWWTGHPDERTDALERAYAGYVEAGERTSAAGVALQLFESAIQRLSMPVAAGWLKRSERMLEGEPPSPVHAVAALFNAFRTLSRGDIDAGFDQAQEALALARQYQARDVEALALNLMGTALVKKGDVPNGMALIDESTTAAVGGELNPWATANVYCGTMGICRDLSDWQRAGEWTEEADREMRRQRISGFPGVCRVHRAEVKRLRGDWPAAEAEARQAAKELYRELRYALHDLGVEDEVVKRALRRYAKFAPKEAADD